jgi:hypothetical protein
VTRLDALLEQANEDSERARQAVAHWKGEVERLQEELVQRESVIFGSARSSGSASATFALAAAGIAPEDDDSTRHRDSQQDQLRRQLAQAVQSLELALREENLTMKRIHEIAMQLIERAKDYFLSVAAGT